MEGFAAVPPARPRSARADVVAGAMAGLLAVVVTSSFAPLLFRGILAPYVPVGVGLALLATVVVAVTVSLTSSYEGTIAIPQDRTAPILALLAASTQASLPADAASSRVFATVITALVLTCVANGAFLILLGRFRLGSLFRFLPYPVVGGFLAGSGWLMVVGALMPTGPDGLAGDWRAATHGAGLAYAAVAIVFGTATFVAARRWGDAVVIPPAVAVGVAGFFAGSALAGLGPHALRAGGWLLGPFDTQGRFVWPILDCLRGADWRLLEAQVPGMGAVLLVSAISVILNSSGIELQTDGDVDVNRELMSAGVANVAGGVAGGIVGFQSLSLSGIAARMGGRGRLVGLVTAAVGAFVLLLGFRWLGEFPRPVLSGILLFIGLRFMAEWLWDGRKRLPRGDYGLLVAIVGVVAVAGYLQGIVVGLAAAVALFVVRYSRIDIVRLARTAAEQSSTVERSLDETEVLRRHGAETLVLALDGFIFFGTANRLLGRLSARLRAPGLPPLRQLVIDFRRVSGLDVSASFSVRRILRLAEKSDFRIGFARVRPALARDLAAAGLAPGREPADRLRDFPDLDHALEWAEEETLRRHAGERPALPSRVEDQLRPFCPDAEALARFVGFLRAKDLAAGETLIRQGDPPGGVYFLESGELAARLAAGDGETIRLRSVKGPGAVLGEVSFYLDQPRSASVHAVRPSRVFELDAPSLLRMEREDPAAAAGFHRMMASLLSDRLVATNRLLQAWSE